MPNPRCAPRTWSGPRPRTSACRAGQLAARYQNGGLATQNHFGNIDIADISPRQCTLTGPLRLRGLTAGGRAATGTVSIPVSPTLTLTPDAGAATLERDTGSALAATFTFAGATTGPPFGQCVAGEMHPASWALALPGGGSVLSANGRGSGGFYSCAGSLFYERGMGPELLPG